MKQALVAWVVMLLSAANLQAAGPVWWGYWNSSLGTAAAVTCHEGTNDLAVRLTALAAPQLKESSIHGLRFWLSDKSAVQRAWIWLSAARFRWGSAMPDKAVREIDPSLLTDMAHDGRPCELFFEAPTELLGSGAYANVYVGVTLEVAGAAATPCRVLSAGSATRVAANACLVNWEQQEAAYGPLALQLLVSGPAIADQGVSISQPEAAIRLAGQDYTPMITVATDGAAAVERIGCRLTIDGEQQPLQQFTLPHPIDEMGTTLQLPLAIAVPQRPKVYDCQVTIAEVNGQPNGSANATATLRLTALSQWPVKRSVMEELTGTWCPNCPRGLVGMRLLEEQFADRFVGIAIHGGSSDEPMRLAHYDGSQYVSGLSARMHGRPCCAIDRTAECDPFGGFDQYYHFGADAVVSAALGQPTVADLAVEAHWNADGTGIDIDAATTFRHDAAEAPYALMLVVTADSLTGEGSEWLQVNNLMGRTEYDSRLSEFVDGERYMKLAYDHVPIWAEGVESGIAGSISAPLQADATQHYRHTADMTGNALLQHPDRLHAVAMLIDSATGRVANVAQCHVEPTATAIRQPQRQAAAATRYLPDGRVASGHSPIIVVRAADGTVRKLISGARR